jgi:hypothetical protein
MNRFPHDPNGVKDIRDFLAQMPGSEPEHPLDATVTLETVKADYERAMNVANNVRGWKVIEVPFIGDDFWNELIGVLGSDNMKVVVMTTRGRAEDLTRRGTILISPEGCKRLKEHVEKKKEESSG